MTDINIEALTHIHFIGIGGIGMSAIAKMMLMKGKKVSGSDIAESRITKELAAAGAHIVFTQTAENIQHTIDLVVYTVAIPHDNPELVSARARGILAITYPEMLGIISRGHCTIAVAGSHGKTTTTAMIAEIMIDAGLDPTVIVGSLLKGRETNCIAGASTYFLAEACEYKRSFLNIQPTIAVITNIDDDHLDYYKNIDGVQKGFGEFVARLGEAAELRDEARRALVCNPSGEHMSPVIAYVPPGVRIENYASIAESDIPPLKIPGVHNRHNAKAALAVARLLGIDEDRARVSLAKFSGTWRRFEFLGRTTNGALVYDDYAHHPSEIRATLSGFRELFPDKKITLVYQPHLYSRTKEHFHEFSAAFALADDIILAPIYAAREPVDPDISSEKLAEEVARGGRKARALPSFEAIATALKANLKADDVLVTMGAGDVNAVAELVLK